MADYALKITIGLDGVPQVTGGLQQVEGSMDSVGAKTSAATGRMAKDIQYVETSLGRFAVSTEDTDRRVNGSTGRMAGSMQTVENSAGRMAGGIDNASGRMAGSLGGVETAIKGVIAAWGSWEIIKTAQSATMFAANVEQADRALSVIANTMGRTSEEAMKYRNSLRDLGITTNSSTNAVAQFMKAGLPLDGLNKLGRATQGAAISYQMMTGEMISSSAALDKMIRALVTGNVTELHTLGINVLMRDTLRENRVATGEAATAVDTHKRHLLMYNDVMEKTQPLMLLYEKSLDLAAKQISSSKRPVEELRLAMGQLFLPELTVAATAFYQSVSAGMKWVRAHTAELSLAKTMVSDFAEGLLYAVGILTIYTSGVGLAMLANGGFASASGVLATTMALLRTNLSLTGAEAVITATKFDIMGVAISTSTNSATVGLLSLKTIIGVLGSFMLGWEVGKLLSNQFAVVRESGTIAVYALMAAWNELKFTVKEFWAVLSSPLNFTDAVNRIEAERKAWRDEHARMLKEQLADNRQNTANNSGSKSYVNDWAAIQAGQAREKERLRKEAAAAAAAAAEAARKQGNEAATVWNKWLDVQRQIERELAQGNPELDQFEKKIAGIKDKFANWRADMSASPVALPFTVAQLNQYEQILVLQERQQKSIHDTAEATKTNREAEKQTIDERNKLLEQGRQAMEAYLSPQEKLAEQQDKISLLFAQGAINMDDATRALNALQTQIDQANMAPQLAEIANTLAQIDQAESGYNLNASQAAQQRLPLLEQEKNLYQGIYDSIDTNDPNAQQLRLQTLDHITQINGQLIEQQKIISDRTAMGGATAALNEYINDTANIGAQTKNLTTDMIQGTEDAFVNSAMNMKLSFKSLADSIIADLIRIGVQKVITGAISGGAGILDSLAGILPFFADGGVTSGPSIAGEAGPEAVVPLPDGRSIPVILTMPVGNSQLADTMDALTDAINHNSRILTKVSDCLTEISGSLADSSKIFAALPGVGATTAATQAPQGITSYLTSTLKDSINLFKSDNLVYTIAGGVMGAIMTGGLTAILTAAIGTNFIGNLVGDLFSSMFGGSKSIEGQGVALGYNKGLKGASYVDVKEDGGWFSGDSHYTNWGAMSSDAYNTINSQVMAIQQVITLAAGVLGQSADNMANAVVPLTKIQLQGVSAEEAAKRIEGWLTTLANVFTDSITSLTSVRKPGEDSFTTLMRLAQALQQVNDVAELTGSRLLSNSIYSADAASKLIDLMGGQDAFAKATDSFFTTFYSDTEQAQAKAAQGASQMNSMFHALGMIAPSTRDGFVSVVQALDLTTDAGRTAYASIMSIADAANDMYTYTEELKKAQDELNNDLTVRSLSVAGRTVQSELYSLQIAQEKELSDARDKGLDVTQLQIVQLDEWNAKIAQLTGTVTASIDDLIAATKKAATDLLDAQIAIATSMKSILSTKSQLSPEAAYLQAQSTFAGIQATLAANPQDMSALQNLPSAAEAFVDASKSYNASGPAFQADLKNVLDTMALAAETGGITYDQVDEQLNALVSIRDAINNTNTEQLNALTALLGPNSTLAGLIGTWNESTAAALLQKQQEAAIATYNKDLSTYTAVQTKAISDYRAGTITSDQYNSTVGTSFQTVVGDYQAAQNIGAAGFQAAAPDNYTSITAADIDERMKSMARSILSSIGPYDPRTFVGTYNPQYDIAWGTEREMIPGKSDGYFNWIDLYYWTALANGTIGERGDSFTWSSLGLQPFATGTPYLNSDGPIYAHMGEAVVDAQSMQVLRKYGIPTSGSADNRETVNELKETNRHLTAMVRALQGGFQKQIEINERMEKRLRGMENGTRLDNKQKKVNA